MNVSAISKYSQMYKIYSQGWNTLHDFWTDFCHNLLSWLINTVVARSHRYLKILGS